MSDTIDRSTVVVTVTDGARATVLDARNAELDAATLGLWLEVGATTGPRWAYDMYFQPVSEAVATDRVEEAGDGLSLVIPASSIDRLRGATLDLAADGSGMVLLNPNEPSRPEPKPMPVFDATALEGPVAARVLHVIETQVNPSIASHGGFATLVGVDGATVYLTMGGGCQGCAMSKATLRQGIEVAIKTECPEITEVVDVTDHASGDNPFYN
jgi:Fe/S biogenesis protein NfuA